MRVQLAEAAVDERGEREETALHLAAWNGRAEVVSALLEAGAAADWRDEFGWTALHYAAYGGHVVALRVLIEAGAVVGARSGGGVTALHLAAFHGRAVALRALLAAGAASNERDNDGDTALQASRDDLTRRILIAEPARRSALALWGVWRFRRSVLDVFPRDVMRLICQAVWATRHDDECYQRE